ncbi:MAG: Glu-tRNA(Gln) amidotransferase subunit GatE [Candidatus Hodarchaeota archaeon]
MSSSKPTLDYSRIGLLCGIEIHQQLKTKRKLFCRCSAEMTTNDPDMTVMRNFRPVLGEMGVFDEAMLLEFKKKMSVIYQVYNNLCTYELDDTPPFECDKESIEIALLIAKVLNMTIIDEFKVCRKNYLDGSVPGGFQRTIIAAKDGYYTLSNEKKIGIEILCLEEDSARRIEQKGSTITFRLDRLGIPLVEIATAPDIKDPEEAKEAAARLGLLLRSTGKVRRGLGVTRQDLNVSIKGGIRVEIKGVQKLDWIPLLVENEAIRQLNLIELKKELEGRKITEKLVHSIDENGMDFSKELKGTKVKFISKGLKNNNVFQGIKVPLMKGLLGKEVQPGRRFGTEISDRVKSIVGLNGIIHSDEDLKKYGFSTEEIKIFNDKLKIGDNDAFILIMGSKAKVKRAWPVIKERIVEALEGVPPETRKALENGNTTFLRGLHGGSRLYPDTDSRSIPIDAALVESIPIPPNPWDIIDEMVKKYKLDSDRVEQLILDGYLPLFNEIIEEINISPSLVLNTLLDTLTALSREGSDIDAIKDNHFKELFKGLAEKKVSKEVIGEVLKEFSVFPNLTLDGATKKLNLSAMSVDDLRKIIKKVIKDNEALIKEKQERAFSPLMGSVMKEARGKIDGKIVSQELKKELEKKLKA